MLSSTIPQKIAPLFSCISLSVPFLAAGSSYIYLTWISVPSAVIRIIDAQVLNENTRSAKSKTNHHASSTQKQQSCFARAHQATCPSPRTSDAAHNGTNPSLL